MSSSSKIYVGSRKSELALIQTNYVISLLRDSHPDVEFEIVTMSTLGDRVLDIPLPKIGEKSLFTKELEAALMSGAVDFVVHSLKDVPTTLPEGMAIGAVLEREDPRDALVLQKDLKKFTLATLPQDSTIGTSSLRRTAQLARNYPHLKIKNIRGNLNTRLKKLDDLGQYQAIILAAAGLIRIGWKDRISSVLKEDDLLYAVGQGALAVECRMDNELIIKLLEPLYDLQTALRVTAERSFLKTLGGGCSAPVAVSSYLRPIKERQFELNLTGAVWSLDGSEEIRNIESVYLRVEKDLRCDSCPYKNKNMSAVIDIENIQCAGKCINDTSDGPSSKKLKLEDIPSSILKNDPHDQSPVKIPIGADFMGKCPYLESQISAVNKNGSADQSQPDYQKCPFLFENIIINNTLNIEHEGSSTEVKDDNLFCGLVAHKDASICGMEEARKLGVDLAQSLISNGALDVMAKAQAVIHSQTVQSITIIS